MPEESEANGINRRDFTQTGLKAIPAAAWGALAANCTTPGGESETIRRPTFEIDTDEAFDSAEIPAYQGNHSSIYANIDRHLDDHLENVRRWLRQPSNSADGTGIEQMAQILRDDLAQLGFQEAELVPTSGHPGVWGFYDAGAETTLTVYMMYDVVPVVPEQWRVQPFAADLVQMEGLGSAVMARGAANQKGPERAFLNAVESILSAEGNLPVNLMIAADGEEEIGSPHYSEIIDRYGERLRETVGAICPHNSQNAQGAATLGLGMKGLLYLELESSGGSHGGPARDDIGGWYKSIVDSPVLRLIQAISSLTKPDGNTIAVPGYYDSIVHPNDEQKRLLNSPQVAGFIGPNGELTQYTDLGVEKWIDGINGRDALTRFLFDTTFNVNGIWAGYTGPGVKTLLPHKATAKIDSRLVPNQRPETALKLIQQHLQDGGFQDIEIRQLAAYPPCQTSVSAPIVEQSIAVYNKYGIAPAVWPRFGASAPFHQFTERLGIPLVLVGLGHGGNMHAPNEYMLVQPEASSKIAGLGAVEKSYVDLLYSVGGS